MHVKGLDDLPYAAHNCGSLIYNHTSKNNTCVYTLECAYALGLSQRKFVLIWMHLTTTSENLMFYEYVMNECARMRL